jgi:hypothetical protein
MSSVTRTTSGVKTSFAVACMMLDSFRWGPGAVLRPVCCCSASVRSDAWALVSVSSIGSWASSQSVFKYERCAAVIGSSPVIQSSGL